jgi:hypothetical protein
VRRDCIVWEIRSEVGANEANKLDEEHHLRTDYSAARGGMIMTMMVMMINIKQWPYL